MNRINTVSYTHLDVYKRQVYNQFVHSIHGDDTVLAKVHIRIQLKCTAVSIIQNDTHIWNNKLLLEEININTNKFKDIHIIRTRL